MNEKENLHEWIDEGKTLRERQRRRNKVLKTLDSLTEEDFIKWCIEEGKPIPADTWN